MKSKRTKATDISPKVRQKVYARDKGCIFCQMGYRMDGECGIGELQCMHFVARSQAGLGKEENLAMGCIRHHQMLDNSEHRAEMKEMFREYLKGIYPEWTEQKLKYDKWSWMNETSAIKE